MARYIDAVKLVTENTGFVQDDDGFDMAVVAVADIEFAPTADVAEVKHGEWINVPPYRALSGEYLKGQECSVCHRFFISEGNTPYSNHPYCCECGAKMDGGKGG